MGAALPSGPGSGQEGDVWPHPWCGAGSSVAWGPAAARRGPGGVLAEGLPAQGAQPTKGALPPVSPEMGCPLLLDLEPVAPTHLGPGPYKTPEVPRPAVPSPHPQGVVAPGPGSAQGSLPASLHPRRSRRRVAPATHTHTDVQASGQRLSIPSPLPRTGHRPSALLPLERGRPLSPDSLPVGRAQGRLTAGHHPHRPSPRTWPGQA